MRFENRSPSRLSSSDDSRASPSPATAIPSSSPTSPPRYHQSTAVPPPSERTRIPATTPSTISFPIHSTASGTNERLARSARIATVDPRWVSYTSLSRGGTYFTAWRRSPHVGGVPSELQSVLLGG